MMRDRSHLIPPADSGIGSGKSESAPALSVVIPVYNEEESIEPLYERIRDACDRTGLSYEALFIDDGSADMTYECLLALRDGDRRIKAIRFRKNYGQTAAMAAGFDLAQGNVIVSMDGDLQNDPADIPSLLEKISEGYDVVCGWRKDRKDKFWTRRFPSIIANRIIGWITGVRIHDNGCSLKAYRASVIKNVRLYGEMHRFIPAMSTLAGAKIAEIVVHHHPRQFGASKYGLSRIWRVILDIVMIKMITGFGSRPMRWFGLLSAPFLLLGFPLLLVMTAVALGGNTDVFLVGSTTAFLLIFCGAFLLSLGIVGELLVKTGDHFARQTVLPTEEQVKPTPD